MKPKPQLVDPSENVKALSEAASKRQDDLRQASEKLHDAQILHLKEIDVLRASHAAEIRQMETQRLDSIRQVDVLARNTATDRASDAIQALAATTATNAENLRTALANTAATLAKQTADTATATAKQTSDQYEAVARRVASLEASAYRGEGRQNLTDPAFAELLKEVKGLKEADASKTGQGVGRNEIIAYIVAAVAVISPIAVHFLTK